MASSEAQLFEFEGFLLDATHRVLFDRDGQRIALKPKVVETLRCLLERRGALIGRRELLHEVWHGAVVEENGLNQHISTLRRVFGERPGDNRFIVTVPGRGYRFVAQVSSTRTQTASGEPVEAFDEAQGAWRLLDGPHLTIPSDREILMSNVYEAPPALAFAAWTEPRYQRLWWSLPQWTLTECDVELNVGGTWCHTLVHEDGTVWRQHGVLREIVRPERLVYTERWDGVDIGELLTTSTFADGGDKTLHTVVVRFASRAARDRMVESGIHREMAPFFDRLKNLLRELAPLRAGDARHRYA
jgi:DNA-binding winged helix-turn-helix (wHTH) protein/uncharacterized protein YndB with AHSA1/START domain